MHNSSQYSRQSIRRTMVYAALTITSTQRHTSLLISSRRRKLEVHHFEVLILMKIFYPGILRTLLMMQTFSNHFIRVIFVIFCPHFFQILMISVFLSQTVSQEPRIHKTSMLNFYQKTLVQS